MRRWPAVTVLGIGLLASPAAALQATTTWTNNAAPGTATAIRVERRDGPDTAAWVQQGPDLPPTASSFNQTGLATDVRYCYRTLTVGATGTATGPVACGTPGLPLPVSGMSVIFAP